MDNNLLYKYKTVCYTTLSRTPTHKDSANNALPDEIPIFGN